MKEKESNTNEPLFSECVKAGQRYYYIDAKKDCNGVSYIVLTESKSIDENGNKKRHRIFLYEEDMDKFAEAFNSVLDFVKANQTKPEQEPDVTQEESVNIDNVESDINLWANEDLEVDWQKKWEE